MANTDRPRGFAPHGSIKSANVYVSGGAVYPGDCVKMDNTGRVVAASAGNTLLGVALEYASAAGASILVSDHPDQLYCANADGSAIDAQTDIGNLADIKATAGNSTYKCSRMELDDATLGTGSGGQMVVMGYELRPDNALGANVTVICKINEHQLVDAFAGI